jgi:hypothetical protein
MGERQRRWPQQQHLGYGLAHFGQLLSLALHYLPLKQRQLAQPWGSLNPGRIPPVRATKDNLLTAKASGKIEAQSIRPDNPRRHPMGSTHQ